VAQVDSKRVWHLSRRDEQPCVVSDRELLLLAELGHLRADDMLWRSDFDGYRTVRSLLGDLPASKQIRVEATRPPLGAVETTDLYTMPTTTLASTKRRLKLVGVAGLLVVMALIAALGLVLLRPFETDSERAPQVGAVTVPIQAAPEAQPVVAVARQPETEPVTANAESPSATTAEAEPEPRDVQDEVIVRTVKVLDIAAPEIPKAPEVAKAPAPVPESSASAVPSPSKKPARPVQALTTASEQPTRSAASGRPTEAPLTSPMGLAPFGFNSGH
jgi:hypothetical protein